MSSQNIPLNPNPNLENKDSPIPDEIKKDEQNSIPNENISISLKSEEDGTSTESAPESKGTYLICEGELLSTPNSEMNSEDKENIKATKSKKMTGKKRKNQKSSNSKKAKNSSNSKIKIKSIDSTPTKNPKEDKNNNNNSSAHSELNNCYNELEKITEDYSFFEVSKVLLKVANEMTEDTNDNHDLYQKLKNISSKIKNNGNLALICLSILSSKIKFKKAKGKEDKKETKIKKQDDSNETKRTSNKDKTGKKNIQKKYIYGEHFLNINNKIYCYRNKTNKPCCKTTLYCDKRHSKGCKAFIVANSNSNEFSICGDHEHEGISENIFYEKFPSFLDKKWTHIQLIKNENNSQNKEMPILVE